MTWIPIAELSVKGEKGDVGNIYLGQLPANQNLLDYYGAAYAGSWGIPTVALVSSTAGRPTGAGPGTLTVIPVGSTASTQTWAEYGTSGRVWTAAVSSGRRISPWKELTAGAHFGNFKESNFTQIDDIDVSSTFTFWSGTDAAAAGAPLSEAGDVETFLFGNAGRQYYRTVSPVGAGPRTMYRGKGSSGWGVWHEENIAPAAPSEPSTGGVKSGFKNVPLALNQPSAGGTEAISNATVRWPLRYGVGAKRVRLHVRNWSFVYGTTYGPVAFTGAWMGTASGANFTMTPIQVLKAFNAPSDGAEYVSPWFTYNLSANVDHLLSVGFTTAEGQTNMTSRGGCYRSTNSADAGRASGFTGAASTTSPFDVWLEVEVATETPVLAGFGDSNTVGTGTALPVYDSWLSQYCRTARALPYFMAIHGSASSTWSDPKAPMWNRHREQARPDAVVYFLGQNDLVNGVTVAEMRANLGRIMPIVRDKLAHDVYVATITPGNMKAPAVNDVRKAYNAWLKTLPLGVKDCYDFSAAVSDDDATIRASDSADGLHFVATGHAKAAAKITERPATPPMLTPVTGAIVADSGTPGLYLIGA